jgi:hypothetical protein
MREKLIEILALKCADGKSKVTDEVERQNQSIEALQNVR